MASPSALAELDLSELRDAHADLRVGPYLRRIWHRRGYVRYVALSAIRGRQMNSLLGNFWYLLNPLLLIGVYALVFGVVLDARRGVDNFLAFLCVGTLLFSYVQRSTLAGAKSIVSNMGLIRSISFPRAVLPLASTLTEAIAALPSVAVMVAVALATGETLAWRFLLLAPLLALVSLFNLGLGMLAARATAQVLDVQQVLPFVFRLLLYGSGVLFNPAAYDLGNYILLFEMNPVYCFIALARWSLLGGSLEAVVAISALVWTGVVLLAGFIWFQRGERSYGLE